MPRREQELFSRLLFYLHLGPSIFSPPLPLPVLPALICDRITAPEVPKLSLFLLSIARDDEVHSKTPFKYPGGVAPGSMRAGSPTPFSMVMLLPLSWSERSPKFVAPRSRPRHILVDDPLSLFSLSLSLPLLFPPPSLALLCLSHLRSPQVPSSYHFIDRHISTATKPNSHRPWTVNPSDRLRTCSHCLLTSTSHCY